MLLFKTRVEKGNIKANEIVKVSNPLDYSTKCIVKDTEGNEEEYQKYELKSFGCFKTANYKVFEIGDIEKRGTETYFKNSLIHLTKNVRSLFQSTIILCSDAYYTDLNPESQIYFDYKYRELTDNEVSCILLEEVLYGEEPDLQSVSCVGTTAKGLDKDPNYHDGYYVLPNEKEYTMTWCGGKIIIREGIDGGWYHDKNKAGRTVYEGNIDWKRYKQAKVKRGCLYQLNLGKKLFEKFPEIEKILSKSLVKEDKYKLNSEFETK